MKHLFVCLFLALCFSASAKKTEQGMPSYGLIGAGTGAQGTYLVEVSILGKSKTVSDNELVAAAVHGVLFRGFSQASGRGFQKPLAGSAAAEGQNADFYKDFFAPGGMASTYGTVIAGTRSISKAGKEYRVKAKVIVQKEALMKFLQDAGTIRSLNSAF